MQIPLRKFGVILADPAWKYDLYSPRGEAKAPQAHYECMSLEEMKGMRDDVIFATGKDCVLVMWATFAMLDQALELLHSWGFKYCTGGAWQKVTKNGKKSIGTGYVFRSSAEIFLIGTHGSPKIKNKSTRNTLITGDVPQDLKELCISVFSQVREHSRKPDEMYELIEGLFDGPYLELFARNTRKNWESCGNETEKYGEVA
ncbi:MAG: hypothetical protein DI551_05305 [Micavibrio aeruginosavorus]|uniref:DNA methyltransferase n=1 Tax=Micavibrio aeruginosavorus TaxID=349221 RepID=A0A2W5PV59_9BACT|nr:MAG: hypothetical protein DI551_05305 [Micavibrio aeruginosavorus]